MCNDVNNGYTHTHAQFLLYNVLRLQVNHESPLSVSKAMFVEAYRLLRPGGHLTILDLDKHNLENLLSSAFVAAIYKQTEPYMGDYLKLDIAASLRDAGFTLLEVKNSSRSHVALIAVKPG